MWIKTTGRGQQRASSQYLSLFTMLAIFAGTKELTENSMVTWSLKGQTRRLAVDSCKIAEVKSVNTDSSRGFGFSER